MRDRVSPTVKPRLLVIELWGLGDVVLASPFLRTASEKFEVTLLAKSSAIDLGRRFWPEVRIVSFVAPWTAFRGKYRLYNWPWTRLLGLRRELGGRFAAAVSARRDPRDHLLMALIGAKRRAGFPRLQSQLLLTDPVDRPHPLSHRAEDWQVLGRALELDVPRQGLQRPVLPERKEILLHSGAGQPVRVWPLDRYGEIVHRLRAHGYQVQIACDADQLAWWQQAGERGAIAPSSLSALFQLIDRSAAFLGNDSGPAHLAAYSGVPTFTLFGPQLFQLFAPLHPQGECFEGKPCPFKPCSDYCRFAKPLCLDGCSTDEVWLAFSRFLNRILPAAAVP
jgi:heptosyltransferase-2